MSDEATRTRAAALRRLVRVVMRTFSWWRVLPWLVALALAVTALVLGFTADRSSPDATSRRLPTFLCLGQLSQAIVQALLLQSFLSRQLGARPIVRRALLGATLGLLGVSLVAGLWALGLFVLGPSSAVVLGYVLLFVTIGASVPAMFGILLAYVLVPALYRIRAAEHLNA